MPETDSMLPWASGALMQAIAHLMRPLVRLALRAGLTFPLAADLLRALYVEVAATEILGSTDRSDSRVSLLTGIHRKEVRRLRALDVPAATASPSVTLNSQMIARWLATPDYADAAGHPHPLPRTGAAPSFEALVRSVTTDVRPRAVLDEWQRACIVELRADGLVALLDTAYVPRTGSERAQSDAALYYLGRNLHDHMAAATANVSTTDQAAPFLDLSLHYDRLSSAAATALRTEATLAGRQLLVRLNRRAQQLADAPPDGGDATHRINFGLYLYAEDEAAAGTDGTRGTSPSGTAPAA